MRRLLITGGAGYLGSELVRQALAGGWEVCATAFARRPAILGARWLPLDIRERSAVEQAFAQQQPDLVIHTAYRQTGPDLWSSTVNGTEEIARACHTIGARLIHLSSDALFDGEPARERYTEADDPSPITPYGEAKAAAERLVEAICPAALVVRTSLIYGGAEPGQHERLIFDALSGRADLAFFSDELRCPIAVGDLAAALLELAPQALGGRLHVAGAEVLSRYDFARAVAGARGFDPGQLRSARSATSGMRRPRNCALDSSRAQALLQTRLRGVAEFLRAQPLGDYLLERGRLPGHRPLPIDAKGEDDEPHT